MQAGQAEAAVELSWALQAALAAGITVACAGVAVTVRRPAMRTLAGAFLLATLASVVIWVTVVATAHGIAPLPAAVLVSLSTPFTPVLAFLFYRQAVHLVAGRTTRALPPVRLMAVAAVTAFVVTFAIGLVAAPRGPLVVAFFGTAASVAAAVWLAVLAGRARAAGGPRAWALRLLQWSFAALALRSSANVFVAAIAYASGTRPQFTLGVTLAQAFLLVAAALLQLIAVLDEERAHSLVQAEQLRQAELSVAASQRLEALGRMAGAVAHDFNNVLAVILTGAQSGLQDGTGGADEELREIESAAKRGRELTGQLLAYARQAPQRVERFDANAQLARMRGLLQRIVGAHATLDIAGAGPPLFVDMDGTQFDQVVMNLVMNARDATPAGGTITVQLKDSAPDMGRAGGTVSGGRGGFIHLTVTDTGHGIPDGVLPHIFEPFYTTKTDGEGTGLGLATCDAIVRRLGGRIDVRSEPGKGTRFDVLIPRATGG